MAGSRIQETWRQVPYIYGEGQWLKKREVALADGLPRIGLTSRLASLVEGSQAKSAKAIQPAGRLSASQLKPLKLHQSFPKKKRKSLSEKRQAQRRSATSINARSVASIWPWHLNLSKTNVRPLLSMRATQRLVRRKPLTIKSITQHLSAGNTELNSQGSGGLGESQARVATI